MRFIIVTQYFPPETGAPQNRLMGFAKELKRKGHDVEVLTAMPNYPQMKVYPAYQGKFFFTETLEEIKIYRSWIFAGTSRSIISRLLNYFSFTFSCWLASYRINGKFDFLICESPPLFTGIAAYFISKRKNARFIFNVSDLWPESAEKLGLIKNKILLTSAYKLEKWLYSVSTLVTGQTKGICKDIATRFPGVKVHWLPNGIDENRFDRYRISNWRIENGFNQNDFIVTYAGIIGYAQGLECILHAADGLKNDGNIKFVIVGEGPLKEELVKLKSELNINSVYFFNGVASDKIPDIIGASNAALIPLRKLDLFKGAIPSKIFENLAMKKPIILGVDGEAKQIFIDDGKCGLFFEPENAIDLAEKIRTLKGNPGLASELGDNGLKLVNECFSRSKITDSFLEALNKI